MKKVGGGSVPWPPSFDPPAAGIKATVKKQYAKEKTCAMMTRKRKYSLMGEITYQDASLKSEYQGIALPSDQSLPLVASYSEHRPWSHHMKSFL